MREQFLKMIVIDLTVLPYLAKILLTKGTRGKQVASLITII
ncbi:hypothetical protein BDFB_011605 [Asbolus verrucosus]|uniref:Uncharacterized protein n=1 Tax=Asbolus verrucosus TaxID=1661398 RepID=A0A482V7I9_ASBVE|nr:hypothetical protein BDFB_011605 [Asbolus verrucosus]